MELQRQQAQKCPETGSYGNQQDRSGRAVTEHGDMGKEQETVAALSSDVTEQVKRYRKSIDRTMLWIITFISIVVVLSFLEQHFFGRDEWLELIANPYVYIPTITLLMGYPLIMTYATRRARPKSRQDVYALARRKDIRAVGALVDALSLEDGHAHRIAMDALIEILQQLKASDSELLTAGQHAKLCRILSLPIESPLYKNLEDLFRPPTDRNVRFRIAILKAYEQIGDDRALPIVEQLANGETKTQAEWRIKQVARECLPYLQQRLAQQTASETLLRASQRSSVGADVLVRPAAPLNAAPDQLLRAIKAEPLANRRRDRTDSSGAGKPET